MLHACRSYARGIGTAFEKRTDLRVIICNALATLCLQNRQALKVSPLLCACSLEYPRPLCFARWGTGLKPLFSTVCVVSSIKLVSPPVP